MKNMKNIIIFICVLCIYTACFSDESIHISIKQDFIEKANEIIDKNDPLIKSYIIIPTNVFINNNGNVTDGYVIGPFYHNIIKGYERNAAYLYTYNGKDIYIYMQNADFCNEKLYKDNVCPDDSVMVYGNVYTKEPSINFIHRGFLIYYKNNNIYIEDDISHYFLPKIEFDSINY